MAKIINGEKEVEINDGESISFVCEDMGVPFSCHLGTCGTCMIKIVKGKENLTELTEEEIAFGMDDETRLACQCKIKSGDVKINFD